MRLGNFLSSKPWKDIDARARHGKKKDVIFMIVIVESPCGEIGKVNERDRRECGGVEGRGVLVT